MDQPQTIDDMINRVHERIDEIEKESLTKGTPKLNAALAKAQIDIKAPVKNRTANVQMKAGGSYTFNFADLSDLETALRGPLGANGISFVHLLCDVVIEGVPRHKLTTQLRHESGEQIESSIIFAKPEGRPQEFGSIMTYLKRYLLSALTSTSNEEDDDGNAAQGNQREIKDRQKKSTPSNAVKDLAASPGAGKAAPAAAKPPETKGPNPLKPPAANPKDRISAEELSILTKRMKESGWTTDQMREFAFKTFGVSSAQDLTKSDFGIFKEAFSMKYPEALAFYTSEPPPNP